MMKTTFKLWLALISSFVILANAASLRAEMDITGNLHSHEQNENVTSELSLDHGKKWQTDAPLCQGMQSINDAVMRAVPAYHQATFTETDADELAREINGQVNYLVINCKLEPGADATLHVLIGDLLTGVAEISNNPLSSQGVPHLVGTLKL
jgi:hypothetical protein